MYIAFGWPKVLKGLARRDQRVVHMSSRGGLLLVVYSSAIQVWTDTQHRVCVGQLQRDKLSIQEEGVNIQALWNSSLETLAVLTNGNVLHFYDVRETQRQLRLASSDAIKLVDIRFRSSTSIPLFGDDVALSGLVADDDHILVGSSNGRLHLVSWRGQLRGSADLWSKSNREVMGPMYLPEANWLPASSLSPRAASSPFSSPATGPLGGTFSASSSLSQREATWRQNPSPGVLQMAFSADLRLLALALLDGRVVLCSTSEMGLRPVDDIVPEKWVGVVDAACLALGRKQQLLLVGSRRGTVELFDLTKSSMHLRAVSLFDWGYSVEDTGPVTSLSFSPDSRAFAVGWRDRGMAVWTISGCRLVCTIRQGSMSILSLASNPTPGPVSRSPVQGPSHGPRMGEPMANGVAAMAWSEHGYHLVAAEGGVLGLGPGVAAPRILNFPLARGCMNKAVAGSVQVWQLMQAEDRVLLVQSTEQEELRVQHLVIPQMYISVNWPVMHVAASDDGSYLAIAGRRGVILHNLRHKKWRVFGDIRQERAIRCVGLLWMGKIVVMANQQVATDMYELCLYPRFHLDESSLLFRQTLPARPIAMDCWNNFILVATPPFEIRVYHVHITGELTPLTTPLAQIHPVRELSIMNLRKPLVAMRFLPWSGHVHDAPSDAGSSADSVLPGFSTPTKGDAAFRMAADTSPRPRGFLESKAGLLQLGDGSSRLQGQGGGGGGGLGNHLEVGSGSGDERDVAATTREHSLRPPGGASSEAGSGSSTPNGLGMEDLSLRKRPSAAGGVHVSGSTPVHLDSATGRTGAGAGGGAGASGGGGGSGPGAFGPARSNSLTDLQRYATSAANEKSYREALAEAVLRQPTRCMLLRADGELSLLDLDRGTEKALVSGVEQFWLTQGRDKAEAALIEEVPWWAYGHRGMQVWYPSMEQEPSGSTQDLQQLDPELDFDREVYPLGVSPAAGVIVGVSQRLALSACSDMPCFEPTPQAQPILPCLLRHLLQLNKIPEAVQLARLSSSRPHFSHSLEWLLFTIFDAETTNQSMRRKRKEKLPPLAQAAAQQQELAQAALQGPSMLQRACNLIRHFTQYLDVVVSVARKTDSRHWGDLFSAAGKSSDLFEECFQKGQYRTATCYILVIEKLEGPSSGQQNALRLLQSALGVGLYELAGELVRFLLRSGREYSYAQNSSVHISPFDEEKRSGDSLLKTFFSFGFTSTAPKERADVLHATVNHILSEHALELLSSKSLRELVAFVKGTHFDLTDFLRSQRGKAARLEDFASALKTIRDKLMVDVGPGGLESRLDAEFLLAHMRSVGFHEWTVVLATILGRAEVLVELFQSDIKLWQAYVRALRVQPNATQFDSLVAELEQQLQPQLIANEEASAN